MSYGVVMGKRWAILVCVFLFVVITGCSFDQPMSFENEEKKSAEITIDGMHSRNSAYNVNRYCAKNRTEEKIIIDFVKLQKKVTLKLTVSASGKTERFKILRHKIPVTITCLGGRVYKRNVSIASFNRERCINISSLVNGAPISKIELGCDYGTRRIPLPFPCWKHQGQPQTCESDCRSEYYADPLSIVLEMQEIINQPVDFDVTLLKALFEIFGSWEWDYYRPLSLDLSNQSLESLKGIEKFWNLEELNLGNNKISDINPLKDLQRLKYLNLRDNKISDISPLQNLSALRHLNLRGNKISDARPLQNLLEIEHLVLMDNKLTNLIFLNNFNNLKHLSLSGNVGIYDHENEHVNISLKTLGEFQNIDTLHFNRLPLKAFESVGFGGSEVLSVFGLGKTGVFTRIKSRDQMGRLIGQCIEPRFPNLKKIFLYNDEIDSLNARGFVKTVGKKKYLVNETYYELCKL